MVPHKNLVLLPFSRLFSTFWNAFQNNVKWVLKNLHCISARYGHFITHSLCKRHTNMNNIKQELLTYEHIAFFHIFCWWNYLQKLKPVKYGNIRSQRQRGHWSSPWNKTKQVKCGKMQFRLHQPLHTNKVRIYMYFISLLF